MSKATFLETFTSKFKNADPQIVNFLGDFMGDVLKETRKRKRLHWDDLIRNMKKRHISQQKVEKHKSRPNLAKLIKQDWSDIVKPIKESDPFKISYPNIYFDESFYLAKLFNNDTKAYEKIMKKQELERGVVIKTNRIKDMLIDFVLVASSPQSLKTTFDFINKRFPKFFGNIYDKIGNMLYYIQYELIFKKPNDKKNQKVYIVLENKKITNRSQYATVVTSDDETQIRNRIEDIEAKDSGLILEGIELIHIKMRKYNPEKGGTYEELPEWIINKRACINIDNRCSEKCSCTKNKPCKNLYKNSCFKLCLIAYKRIQELKKIDKKLPNPSRISNYTKPEFFNLINMGNVEEPVKLNEIYKIEDQNKMNIKIYRINNSNKEQPTIELQLIPRHIYPETVNLLLLDKHYVLISDISRLRSTQNSKSHGKVYICEKCDKTTRDEAVFIEHLRICGKDNEGRTKINNLFLPKEEERWMTFKNYQNILPVGATIIADFEATAMHQPTCEYLSNKCSCNPKHSPNSYAFKLISKYCDLPLEDYIAEDDNENVAEHFIDRMYEIYDQMQEIYNNLPYIELKKAKEENIITNKEIKQYYKTNICHICKKKILKDDAKVMDHCHLTGKYRGAAHKTCNFKYTEKKEKLVIFFHNGSKYDFNFIIRQLGKYNDKIMNISKTGEQFIFFDIGPLKFVDSYRFLSKSLQKLALGSSEFKYVYEVLGKDVDINDVIKKGDYPYEWIDTVKKFNYSEIPSFECFQSSLQPKNKKELVKASVNAHYIFEKYNMKTFKDYHRFYLRLDVGLLSDVMNNFRNKSIEIYGLDPFHYITCNSYSWDCMLKKTNVFLELLTEEKRNIHDFFKQNIRGGVSVSFCRRAKANPEKGEHIVYIDANNLYGYAMNQYLPTKSFINVEPSEWNEERIMNINTKREDFEQKYRKGYCFSVDISYPNELKKHLIDYPPMPISQCVDNSMVSSYTKNILGEDYKEKTPKLLTTLEDKKYYGLHYRHLQFLLKLGLKLEKIHSVIEFDEERFLVPYIELNTKHRDFFKHANKFHKCLTSFLNDKRYSKKFAKEIGLKPWSEGLEINENECIIDFKKNFVINKEYDKFDFKTLNENYHEFEIDLFKLFNNNIFGKSIENVAKRQNYELVNCDKRLEKLTSSVFYISDTKIDDGLTCVHSHQRKIKENKPIFVGFAILELSKVLMYESFYFKLIPKIGRENIKLLYTDTDSMILKIKSDDIETQMKDKELFDDDVLGAFKNEHPDDYILSFVSLKSKMYAYKYIDKEDYWKYKNDEKMLKEKTLIKKVAKGIHSSSIKTTNYDDYKRLLKDSEEKHKVTSYGFKTKLNEIYTVERPKIGLSHCDTKMQQISPTITIPYGYKNPLENVLIKNAAKKMLNNWRENIN